MKLDYRLRGGSRTNRDGSPETASPELSATFASGSGTVTVGGRTFPVEVVSVGARHLRFKADGRLCDVAFVREHGRLLFWVDGTVLEFSAVGDDDDNTGTAAGGFHPQVRAPMPAKVLSVEVEVGQEVDVDEPLILVEAMKMETTIRAAAPCRVVEIRTQTGQSVAQEEILLVLEQNTDAANPDALG